MARILIIEDDTRLETTYNFLFEKKGHTVIRGRDGEEGLELAKTQSPDIILLDIMMPKLDGLDFLRLYHDSDVQPKVKVIVFSNMQSDDYVHEAMRLGAYRYEVKATFSPTELATLVENSLADTSTPAPVVAPAPNPEPSPGGQTQV